MTRIFKIVRFIIWFLCSILLIEISFTMLNASDTGENILGFILLVILVIVTIETKCLIKIKKNEK